MSSAIFPKLRGKSWSIHYSPQFSTRKPKHVSGRVVSIQLYKYPLYLIELKYDGLVSNSDPSFSGLGALSMQALEGFFLSRGGAFDTFLLKVSDITGNTYDSWVQGMQLGVGDGTTRLFTFQREVVLQAPQPPYIEPVGQVEPVGVNVYVNGGQVGNWTLKFPNGALFGSAPAVGAIITADFLWYHVCQFADDTLDFEGIAQYFWQCGAVKLQTVKLP